MAVPKGRKVLTVYLPEAIHDGLRLCAESAGQSMSSFAVLAIAQRVRNWHDPITGEKVVRAGFSAGDLRSTSSPNLVGWVCEHPACDGPAAECRKPAAHKVGRCWFSSGENIYWEERGEVG